MKKEEKQEIIKEILFVNKKEKPVKWCPWCGYSVDRPIKKCPICAENMLDTKEVERR